MEPCIDESDYNNYYVKGKVILLTAEIKSGVIPNANRLRCEIHRKFLWLNYSRSDSRNGNKTNE